MALPGKRYRSKVDFILTFTSGKRVLDLGCVQHEIGNAAKKNWLHGAIKRSAESVFGVDYLPSEVDALNKMGYDVVCADVETMRLDRTFEVVTAGDLIEHLANPGLFLDRVRMHLAPQGVFVVTTPNPVTFLRFMRLLLLGWVGGSEDHTCWFTRRTMRRMAQRNGFDIVAYAYIDDVYQWYRNASPILLLLASPFLLCNYLLARLRPQLSETTGFVLKLREPQAGDSGIS